MDEEFTEQARKAMLRAHDEALRLYAKEIRTEHILLGLVGDLEGTASAVLSSLGLELELVRLAVEKAAIESLAAESAAVESGAADSAAVDNTAARQTDPVAPPIGERSFADGAKRAVELAVVEARQLDNRFIGTEHILLGLIGEGEGMAAKVLGDLGVDRSKVRDGIQKLQADTPGENRATPSLDQFGRDLTLLARQGKLGPVFGREEEIERVVEIFFRRTKNNPILVGQPGVGKTAIVYGLAQRIIAGPDYLRGYRLIALDPASIVAGARFRGEVEERLRSVLKEIREGSRTIVFIDRLRRIGEEADADWTIDAWNVLKAAVASGEIQCIATMGPEEYRGYVGMDGALEGRLEWVPVEPLTREQVIFILKGLRGRYETHHRVTYSDASLAMAVDLARLYLPDHPPLRAALDIIDTAGARQAPILEPDDLPGREKEINDLRIEEEKAARDQDLPLATALGDRVNGLQSEYTRLQSEWLIKARVVRSDVGERDIQRAVSKLSGIPVSSVAARTEIPIPWRTIVSSASGASGSSGASGRALSGVSRFERWKNESILPGSEGEIRSGYACILIPRRVDGLGMFEGAILLALESYGLRAVRAGIHKAGPNLEQVWSSIRSAEVIVADVRDMDADVIYELGLCHVLKQSPILLVSDPAALPFHLRSLRHIPCGGYPEGVAEVRSKLTVAIGAVLREGRGAGG